MVYGIQWYEEVRVPFWKIITLVSLVELLKQQLEIHISQSIGKENISVVKSFYYVQQGLFYVDFN